MENSQNLENILDQMTLLSFDHSNLYNLYQHNVSTY